MKNNYLVFLDFDGVLFDTVREAYAIAVITVGMYSNISEIDFESTHYKKFRQFRYLVSPAWNYKYILELLNKNLSDKDFIEEYNFIIKNNDGSHKDFENKFFETRTLIKKNDYEKWLRLNTAFPFLHKIKSYIYNNLDNWYIVTTKDRGTVKKLLDLENIPIKETMIFDRDDYSKFENKREIIQSLINKNENCKINVFIDDSKKHLEDCKTIENINVFQPNWGYNLPEDETLTEFQIIKELKSIIGVD